MRKLKLKNHQVVFIGAGLFSLTAARLLADEGIECVIFEKSNKIGGNCSDSIDANTGILYHEYGPHIMHIDNADIMNFLNRFSNWVPYHHEVKTVYNDCVYPIPVNLETINKFFNVNLTPTEAKKFLHDKSVNFTNPKNMEEKLLSLIGVDLYEAFFKNYTIKQWGKNPINLPSSTIQRIPVRFDYSSSYYKKKYSYLPEKSYSEFFKNLLGTDIKLYTNTNITLDDINKLTEDPNRIVVYTGAVDELYKFKYGELDWRSVLFEKEVIELEYYQGTSVINYPEEKYSFTRICEPKHFYKERYFDSKNTIILKETSHRYTRSNNNLVPCYPIADEENIKKYQKYVAAIKANHKNIYFKGRLGSYRYTDMENTISDAYAFVYGINK